MRDFREQRSAESPCPDPTGSASRQSHVFHEPGREGGNAFLLCDGMRLAGPGSGLSPRSVNELPHHEVRDGPRYVSKRNSFWNDCRAHIAVVLMSHVPVDAPAAREAVDLLAAPYRSVACCSLWFMLALVLSRFRSGLLRAILAIKETGKAYPSEAGSSTC